MISKVNCLLKNITNPLQYRSFASFGNKKVPQNIYPGFLDQNISDYCQAYCDIQKSQKKCFSILKELFIASKDMNPIDRRFKYTFCINVITDGNQRIVSKEFQVYKTSRPLEVLLKSISLSDDFELSQKNAYDLVIPLVKNLRINHFEIVIMENGREVSRMKKTNWRALMIF